MPKFSEKFTNYLYELQISEKYMSSCSQILEKVINCLSKRGENNHPSPKAIPVLPDASSITAVTMEGSASDDGSASATGFNLHQRQAQDLPWLGGRLLVWEGDFPVYLHCARGDAELCGELCWGGGGGSGELCSERRRGAMVEGAARQESESVRHNTRHVPNPTATNSVARWSQNNRLTDSNLVTEL